MIAITASGRRVLDPWLALLAGDRVWADDDEPPGIRQRLAGVVELAALSCVTSLLWAIAVRDLVAIEEVTGEWRRTLAAAVAATLAAGVLAIRPAALALGRPNRPADFLPRLVWRGACFLILTVGIAVLMPGWLAAGAWAVGIVIGVDVTLSAWALGLEPLPIRWWQLFLISPLHFGVLGALVAITLFRNDGPGMWTLATLYLALHVGVVAVLVTIRALTWMSEQLDHEAATARRTAAVQERRHRAHWLHDDVLAEIRLTTLRLQRSTGSPSQALAELEELDHRLRIRQLDELYEGGSVRLADILQPHVRRAQTLGVRFTAMPPLDEAGRHVDPATGRLFGRVVAVLLSNAINAGARSVALGLDADAEVIQLRVADDAGGFDFDARPPGRGLDQLVQELGRGNLSRVGLPGGSLMMADIRVGNDDGDDDASDDDGDDDVGNDDGDDDAVRERS